MRGQPLSSWLLSCMLFQEFGSRSKVLYFSLGCMVILLLNILIASITPASNPDFKIQTLIAYLPIYRHVTSLA